MILPFYDPIFIAVEGLFTRPERQIYERFTPNPPYYL